MSLTILYWVANQTGVPIRLSKTLGKPKSGVPELGQQTEEILLEFSYSWDEVSNLKEKEVIQSVHKIS